MQILGSKSFPLQFLPPLAGAGESHFLCLDSVPPPQLWEHLDQSLQEPQDPFFGVGFKAIVDVVTMMIVSRQRRERPPQTIIFLLFGESLSNKKQSESRNLLD